LLAAIAIVGLGFLCAAALAPILGSADVPTNLPGPARGQEIQATGLRVVAVGQVLVIALTLLAAMLFSGRARDVLALHPAPGGWRTYAGAFLAMVALQLVLAAIEVGFRHDVATDLRPFVGLARGPDWPLTAAVVGIGAPLSEELLFRGFLLSALARSRLGFWGAAIVSTLLWSGLHAGYSLAGLAEVFVIGLFFSWLVWRTGSLRVAIACHATYNSLIVLALRFVDLPAPG
jgi:membrane protease YdiL (CAAX protease family)